MDTDTAKLAKLDTLARRAGYVAFYINVAVVGMQSTVCWRAAFGGDMHGTWLALLAAFVAAVCAALCANMIRQRRLQGKSVV